MAQKRTKLIVGNWKMHLRVDSSKILAERIEERLKVTDDVEVVVCPGSISLAAVAKAASKVKIGAQNLHYRDEGAFTGEVSATQVAEFAEYAIVGHSERRYLFEESEETIARKVAAAVRNGLTPILCVGENLFQRQDRETNVVIHDQLTAGLTMLTSSEVANMVIAYEPVWAIGTGDNAKPDHVVSASKAIRHTVSELYGAKAAKSARVLYGGSVTPESASTYLGLEGVDGLLVGGASLNYESFVNIVNKAHA